MKASQMYINTLRDVPKEAEIDSHILLLRSGMIKKMVSGVYNYMPIGLKVLKKIENIIREELDKVGCEEILCSALQPKELWEESGRWAKYGPELMRLKDRHNSEFCLGPTHEEVFTSIVRDYVKSYKDLPLNIYQIQTKYRDEMRPRFGLMRGREFIMKDAYSFDKNEDGLDKSYDVMYKAYSNIFDRLGLNYTVVLADTGAIGGSVSHQFMALSEIGESLIIYNDNYAADQEKAEAKAEIDESNEALKSIKEVSTPSVKTIDELVSFLNIPIKKTVKALVFKNRVSKEVVVCLLRGDRELNEIKLVNYLDWNEFELEVASEDDIRSILSVPGFIGPVGLKGVRIIADIEVEYIKNAVTGSNKSDIHLMNVNFGRDYSCPITDLRLAKAGDLDIIKGEPLKAERGIEVGQIFKLGTKYSLPMKALYTDEAGKLKPIVMGCYGIGVSRTLQAIIEQNHDERGIIFPDNLAPYKVAVIPIKYQDEMKDLSDQIYEKLNSLGVSVVLDDRSQSFGSKAADFELMGVPYIIVVGRDAKDSKVEFKNRHTKEVEVISMAEAITKLTKQLS